MIPILIVANLMSLASSHDAPTGDYPIQPVPFTQVHIKDKFWGPRIETNRTVTIPYAFGKCEETGRVLNFVHAAETLKGEDPTGKPLPGYPFDDTDIYKIIEGASYSLSVKPDAKLEAYLDSVIDKIAAAQEPDGYLYPARTINPAHPHAWSGSERWVNEEEQSHELYNQGHLYEAATAHYWATGKRNFLNVAIKSADLLAKTFGPGKRKIWPGHEIVEMGLVKMFRATGKREYLDTAKFMIECRGDKPDGAYWQSHKPVLEQTEAVGHAVRAAYLYTGVADVAAMTGDSDYIRAIDTLWSDVVGTKLYITGGIGARGGGEAFGPAYELPNASAYAETCAAIGNDYWNERLFLLHGDAKYVDVFERTLYNGLLSGIGLDGKSFFYPNPLANNGHLERSPWFGCACCPSNVARFIPSVPGYVYAQRGNEIFVNLYVASTSEIKLASGSELGLEQETNYPWDGNIRIKVSKPTGAETVLKLRIPGWARGEAAPGGLYSFVSKRVLPYSLKLNGKKVDATVENGYVTVAQNFKAGDVIDLDLPMPTQVVKARAEVEDDKGLVAYQRGPIVYCAEGKDNDKGRVQNLVPGPAASMTATAMPDLLGGVVTLSGPATATFTDKEGKMVTKPGQITLIPYEAWCNRGKNEMAVWLAAKPEAALPVSLYMPAYAEAKVTTSGGTSPHSINDMHKVTKSGMQGDFFHWWPKKGTTEWVEYSFAKPVTVSETSAYWFDDTGVGECRVPKAWRMSYKDASGAWVPVSTTDSFDVAIDKYNLVHFAAVTTSAVRIEVDLQPGWSGGIQQWIVK